MHSLTTKKTFKNKQEAIAYLELTLMETLLACTEPPGSDQTHMWCIDATAQVRKEVGCSPDRVGEAAIAFLESAGDHHVGVRITAGDHQLSIKVSPDTYHMEMTPSTQQNHVPDSHSSPSSPSVSEESPPGLPGLSSGVPSPASEALGHPGAMPEPWIVIPSVL